MANYRVLEKAFIGNKLVEANAIVELDAKSVTAADKHLQLMTEKQAAADAKAAEIADTKLAAEAKDLREKAAEARAKSDAAPGHTEFAVAAAEAEAKADEADAKLNPQAASDLL